MMNNDIFQLENGEVIISNQMNSIKEWKIRDYTTLFMNIIIYL